MENAQRQLSQIPLLDLTTGFMSFKTFAAAVEMDVFTRLAGGREVSPAEFAAELDLQHRPATVLLAALTSLDLLEQRDGKYRNSAIAAEFLVEGTPYYFGGFVQFYNRVLYPGWQNIGEALRTDRPLFMESDDQDSVFAADGFIMTEFFGNAMHSLSGFTAKALAEVYDFGQHQSLLDVGGGSGGFPIDICRRVPTLTANVYELPHVCLVATKKIKAAGLEDVIGTIAGDFTADPALPGGHDVIVLSQVLHLGDEQANRRILDMCMAALPPGGAVLICELLLNPERTGPASAALMGMNMLIAHTGGQNYSETEYLSWLADAGFVDLDVVRFEAAGANGAIVGRAPVR